MSQTPSSFLYLVRILSLYILNCFMFEHSLSVSSKLFHGLTTQSETQTVLLVVFCSFISNDIKQWTPSLPVIVECFVVGDGFLLWTGWGQSETISTISLNFRSFVQNEQFENNVCFRSSFICHAIMLLLLLSTCNNPKNLFWSRINRRKWAELLKRPLSLFRAFLVWGHWWFKRNNWRQIQSN